MAIRLNPDIVPDLLVSIAQSQQNLDTADEQLATGLRVNQLSDDPAAAAAYVGNRTQYSEDGQFLQNIGTLQAHFQTADSTLGNVVTLLTRAVSIGTEGANGTLSASDRQAIAGEVQGLSSQLLGLANTESQGVYLFSGTSVGTEPFTQDPATGNVTYNGNSNVTQVQLSNATFIGGNVPGSQLFQNSAGNAFSALQDLSNALISGNNIGAAVTEVNNALNTVSTQRVFYGNSLNQISISQNFLNQDQLNLSTQENTLVGADLAQAASNFSQAQTANQAALETASRVLNLPTILDYLQ
jgi:flagellar hook-associated protein 3 FlgL